MSDEPTIQTQLAVINTKLDTLIQQRTDHEVRLRKLEQFKWQLLGSSGVVSLLISGATTYLGR